MSPVSGKPSRTIAEALRTIQSSCGIIRNACRTIRKPLGIVQKRLWTIPNLFPAVQKSLRTIRKPLRIIQKSLQTIPNLFPILGTEAWLWWSGAGLQLTTVLSLTIAFGIAVDDTTHFLSHYLHSRREEGKSHAEAIHHTMERIGGAIVAATLILCSGTAIVMFSALPQVALFGTLFVITLGFALIGDVFILPALLVAGGRFFHPLGGVKK